MRLQRNAEKRNARSISGSDVYFVLCRNEEEHLVDQNLWFSMLNLAARHGWAPHGIPVQGPPEAGDYVRPVDLRVSPDEAEGLARSVEVELPNISDDEEQLTDDDEFGEEHTELLVSLRIDGKAIGDDDVGATRKILSGMVKKDARRLVAFLHAGGFWVEEG